MAVLRYLSHPQVVIDPDVPVPDWPLSDQGRARLVAMAGADWLAETRMIVSSAERKARETAAIIGAMLDLKPAADPDLGEIDRSSTGYLPHDRHEAVADAFFARPEISAEGWETATAVQHRGLAALRRHLARHRAGDLLIVGHGGIGTMIWCGLTGADPRGRPDQPSGGGCLWAINLRDLSPLHGWQTMERVASGVVRC